MVLPNHPVTLAWVSENATSATLNGKSIEVAGSQEVTVTKTTTYNFKFKSGSKSTTCSLTAVFADGTISYASLSSQSSKPTLSGTAKGLSSVRVSIKQDVFSDKPLTSKKVKVKKGTWELKVPVSLNDGTYSVDLYGSDDLGLNYIQSGTLTVSAGGKPGIVVVTETPNDTTIALGSTAKIATARITNTSKGIATVSGVWVTLGGNMPPLGVIGLSMKADNGEATGASGMMEGYTPFKTKYASIPGSMTLDPGETRVLTMEAKFSNDPIYKGKKAQIGIYSLATMAEVSGSYTTSGATFTVQ